MFLPFQNIFITALFFTSLCLQLLFCVMSASGLFLFHPTISSWLADVVHKSCWMEYTVVKSSAWLYLLSVFSVFFPQQDSSRVWNPDSGVVMF